MRRFFRKRNLLIFFGIIGLLIIWWTLEYTGLGQKPDFQEYTPTKFPAGLSLKPGGDFYVLAEPNYTFRQGAGLPTFIKHVNIYFNQPNSWIAEVVAHPSRPDTCQDQAADAHCESLATPKGQTYILSAGTIDFVKGSTEIIVYRDIPDKQAREAFIDSFVPTNFTGLTTLKGSAGGG